MSLDTAKLTTDEVRKAVELFWSTFLAKSEEELNEFYASGSTVFQIAMARSEPGRLGAMRRSREYFSPDTRMELKLSPVDIVLCGNDAGVASYTFQFQATGPRCGWQTHVRKTGNRAGHARYAPRRVRQTAHRSRTFLGPRDIVLSLVAHGQRPT